jgi:hypothetical protein
MRGNNNRHIDLITHQTHDGCETSKQLSEHIRIGVAGIKVKARAEHWPFAVQEDGIDAVSIGPGTPRGSPYGTRDIFEHGQRKGVAFGAVAERNGGDAG